MNRTSKTPQHTYRVVCLLLAAAVCSCGAVTPDQVDTFSDAHPAGWGGGAFPRVVSTGGPRGAGDAYLEFAADNGNLGTRNTAQWAGDYVAAGVAGVMLNVLNLGPQAVQLRLLLVPSLFGTHGGQWATRPAAALGPTSGWQRVFFPFDEAHLLHVGGGTGRLEDTLRTVAKLTLHHDPDAPDGSGTTPPVTATVGIDNVRAVVRPVIVRAVGHTNASVRLTWSAIPDVAYRAWGSTNLVDWQALLPPPEFGSSGAVHWADAGAATNRWRYYRVTAGAGSAE